MARVPVSIVPEFGSIFPESKLKVFTFKVILADFYSRSCTLMYCIVPVYVCLVMIRSDCDVKYNVIYFIFLTTLEVRFFNR